MAFDMNHVLLSGSVVRVLDDPSPNKAGIMLHFINPLLTPNDLPATRTFDDESGKNTTLRMSEEAAESLMYLLIKRYQLKKGTKHG